MGVGMGRLLRSLPVSAGVCAGTALVFRWCFDGCCWQLRVGLCCLGMSAGWGQSCNGPRPGFHASVKDNGGRRMERRVVALCDDEGWRTWRWCRVWKVAGWRRGREW